MLLKCIMVGHVALIMLPGQETMCCHSCPAFPSLSGLGNTGLLPCYFEAVEYPLFMLDNFMPLIKVFCLLMPTNVPYLLDVLF